MEPASKKIRRNLLLNPLLYATIGTLFFALIGGFMIYFSSLQYTKNELNRIVKRMHEGIQYENGAWNLFYLDSDPELPGSNPHYILSANGYVIERWRPISGYLDTANLDYILSFSAPQTVTTPLKEKWRVFTRPIKNENDTVGGILVARYISDEENTQLTDQKILHNMKLIESKLKFKNDSIDVSALDFRNTNYDIAVKIVDKYNQLLAKTNNSNSKDRAPNYIDKSYVRQEIRSKGEKILRDSKTHEPFLVMNSPIYDKSNRPVGTIIVAKSLSFLEYILKSYLLSALALSAIILPITWYIDFLIKNHARSSVISFNKTQGILFIESTPVEIPINSHQYHLTRLLFENPGKAVDADEISVHFEEPEDQEGSLRRKVYDAMLLVNKKVEPLINGKLFVIQNKQFVINPEYLTNIRH
jgi:hypothetical protein